jgi:hypothetical protein
MDLPRPWELRESLHYPGRCYYFNQDTHESSWTRPVPYPGHVVEWPAIVYVHHLLIRHSRSGLPGVTPVQRTPDEAKQLIQEIWNAIVNQTDQFDDVVRARSEDPATRPTAGAIGWIKKGEMAVQFEKMAWQLKIGEMSPPVETPAGWHLIVRRG